jgi:hypothetical protein
VTGLIEVGNGAGGFGWLPGDRIGAPARGEGRLTELRRWLPSLDPGRGPFITCAGGGPPMAGRK